MDIASPSGEGLIGLLRGGLWPSVRWQGGPQQVAAGCGKGIRGLGSALAVIGVGDDGGYLGERADPVHGDLAELAGVREHVRGSGVGDHYPPRRDLMRVVVGEPGLGVHAAGTEEESVRVVLTEERL